MDDRLNIHQSPGIQIRGEDHGEILFLHSARFYFHPDVIIAQIPKICASRYRKMNLEALLPPQLNRDLHIKLVTELHANKITLYFRATSAATNGKDMVPRFRKIDQVPVSYPMIPAVNESGFNFPVGTATSSNATFSWHSGIGLWWKPQICVPCASTSGISC